MPKFSIIYLQLGLKAVFQTSKKELIPDISSEKRFRNITVKIHNLNYAIDPCCYEGIVTKKSDSTETLIYNQKTNATTLNRIRV